MDFDDQPDDLNFSLDNTFMAPCAILAIQRVLLLYRLLKKQQWHMLAHLYAARGRPRSYIRWVANAGHGDVTQSDCPGFREMVHNRFLGAISG